MSLLSDILSKIRPPEPRKEIPPKLRSTVSEMRRRELTQKRVILLLIFSILTISAGFGVVYILENHVRRQTSSSVALTRQKDLQVAPGLSGHHSSQTIHGPMPAEKPLEDGKKKNMQETTIAQLQRGRINAEDKTKVDAVKGKSTEEKGIFKERLNREEVSTDKTPSPTQETITEKTAEDKPDKDFYLHMAKDYESRKDYSKALDSYKKVLSIEPKNYRVMNNIASILIRQGLNEEASIYLRRVIEMKNDYVPGLINMGIVLARLGDFSGAENYLLKALALEPDNRQVIFNIALFYEKEGKYERASEYYSRLEQLGDTRGILGLERIKTVRVNKEQGK